MEEDNQTPNVIPTLSDKDYQLVSKTFRKVCELYYENTNNQEHLQFLILITDLIPQIVPSKNCTNGLTITSQMEILKAKARNNASLATKLENTLKHLKNPKYTQISGELIVSVLQQMQLFSVGCIVVLQYYSVLKQNHSIDWKIVIDAISQNINTSPHLSIDILNQLSKNNDQNIRLIAKSGLIKYIFFTYVFSAFKDKFNLYKALKLIRLVSTVDKSVLRDKQTILAKIIQFYQEYIPIISDVCSKCYDEDYSKDLMKKNIYEESNIDFPFIWSHSESFCQEQLNQQTVENYCKVLKDKPSGSFQSKIFAILSNYSKHCKYFSNDLLKRVPQSQQSLLNYLKLCFSMTQNDSSAPYFINWSQIDKLLSSSSNIKIGELATYLKEMRNKQVKVGSLDSNLRKVFSSEKNADMMMQRASIKPKNNEELQSIKQILALKQMNTEFDSDTLKMAKQKACNSLRQSIASQKNLDINSILNTMDLSDVHLVSRFLQVVELYLMMFQDEIDKIDLKRLLEVICWVEDNYNGEIIDWGSISQLLMMLCEEGEWKKHLKTLPKYCFWILSIEKLTQDDQKQLWNAIKKHDPIKMNKKMTFVIGFLGKIMSNLEKAQFLTKHKIELQSIVSKFIKNQDYQLNAMMLSFFLKGWGQQQEDYQLNKYKKHFQQFIAPINNVISSHLRLIPQEYYLLEACLPFKITTKNISTDIESLVKSNGKLASHLFDEQRKMGKKTFQGQISKINNEPAEAIHQSMLFGQKFPDLIKANQLDHLVTYISEESQSYWQLYPRYPTIISNIINIISQSQNQQIRHELTKLCQKLIAQVNRNDNLTDDQRQQLYEDIRDCFENMKERGVYIQIQRIKTIVTKIVQKQIRQEIIIILNDYKVKEEHQMEMNMFSQEEERSEKKAAFMVEKEEPRRESLASFMKNQRQVQNSNVEDQYLRGQRSTFLVVTQSQPKQEAFSSIKTVQNQYQSVKNIQKSQNLDIFQTLKKVINNEYQLTKFYDIFDKILETNLTESEKQLLGSLLVQLFHRYQQQKIITLITNKEKTILSKQQVFELVTSHIPAFALSRRWKLVSRQYLNLAMKRVKEGFLCQGCQVVNYNLVKTSQLEHFYSQKYHHTIFELIQSSKLEDQVSNILSVIGMAARFPQIRSQWISIKLPSKILKFVKMFPKSTKVIGNLSFALSALTFQQNDACIDVVKQTELMYIYLDSVLCDPTNHSISQYSSLFIGNLSFSKCFESVPNFQISKVINTLKQLFDSNLGTQNFAPFKHLLKAFGNMSLIKNCSSMILDEKFCSNMITFSQKVDIMTSYDQKKGKHIKLLLDLVSNLAKNKDKLALLHQCKITLLTSTLLQITQASHTELIASCIDAIDAMSQDPNIQLWYVSQKKLPYVIMDILKLQTQEKLIIKATRLVTNLTLHSVCVPHLLKSNILGIFANVVIPQLAAQNSSAENKESRKKIELYIIKALSRIHQVNPQLQLILKGGYLDCLVRIIQMIEVNEVFLDILFHYSSYIPNFLSQRAFSSMIKILTVKVNDKDILAKCIQSLKNILSFSYDVNLQDTVFKGIPEMYLKFIQSDYTSDALFLLAYHLIRSAQFRQLLRKPDDKLQIELLNRSKIEEFTQVCKAILFLIYSPPIQLLLQTVGKQNETEYYQIMKKGFKCKLYRTDGTYKDAKVDIDHQYNFRVYKYPDGQIKKKYCVNIRHIRQFQISFENHPYLWKHSIFPQSKGLFSSHQAVNKHCCSLVSNSKWGQINFVNIEFENLDDKNAFHHCISHLIAIFRL